MQDLTKVLTPPKPDLPKETRQASSAIYKHMSELLNLCEALETGKAGRKEFKQLLAMSKTIRKASLDGKYSNTMQYRAVNSFWYDLLERYHSENIPLPANRSRKGN